MAGAFFRHRSLIAFSAGGAMAEAVVLSFVAPAARPLAPQVTALPPLAAYHDLRWLFAFNQSWAGFISVLVLLVLGRSAVDTVLIWLAWPREPAMSLAGPRRPGGSARTTAGPPAIQAAPGTPPVAGIPRPRFLASLVSCSVLTVLVGLVMSPVVTLMFGVALVPFSWPYLAAVLIMLGTAAALSQGGVGPAWWRRLPPVRTAAWVIATFVIMSLASVLMVHLDTPAVVAVAGLAGVVNARAWYGLTTVAVRRSAREVRGAGAIWGRRFSPGIGGLPGGRPPGRKLTSWVPMAPLAAVLVIALMVGLTRLAFTGTVRFAPATSGVAAGTARGNDGLAALSGYRAAARASGPGTASTAAAGGRGPAVRGAVLVAEGFGSSCCQAGDALGSAEPGMLVRQFSYLGLTGAGRPIPYGPAAGDLPIQLLGDRMAAQVEKLYRQARTPVDIVAESEGTLGLYAMLARHPHVPVGSLVLLSPIVEPGQLGRAGATVPGAALITLNSLVGGMSPYGSSGAQALIDSVSRVGASYYATVSRDRDLPWLAVIPLADAVTLPACSWPENVMFVEAFHGGLLGDASVRQMIEAFLASGSVPPGGAAGPGGGSQQHLRAAAQLISAAATAWRMPELRPACSEHS